MNHRPWSSAKIRYALQHRNMSASVHHWLCCAAPTDESGASRVLHSFQVIFGPNRLDNP